MQGKHNNQLVNTVGNRLFPRDEPKPYESAKETKEQEDSTCMDACATQNRAVAESPPWQRLASTLAKVLDKCLVGCQVLDSLLESCHPRRRQQLDGKGPDGLEEETHAGHRSGDTDVDISVGFQKNEDTLCHGQ